jgi:hypothetical protein
MASWVSMLEGEDIADAMNSAVGALRNPEKAGSLPKVPNLQDIRFVLTVRASESFLNIERHSGHNINPEGAIVFMTEKQTIGTYMPLSGRRGSSDRLMVMIGNFAFPCASALPRTFSVTTTAPKKDALAIVNQDGHGYVFDLAGFV